jgi:hypothetical protein
MVRDQSKRAPVRGRWGPGGRSLSARRGASGPCDSRGGGGGSGRCLRKAVVCGCSVACDPEGIHHGGS